MFDFSIIEFLSQYAYQPTYVYGLIICLMTASSFGLPIPEEVTLVSAGLVAYMALHPAQFPPPYEGAEGVNLTVLSTVCFLAVLGSDLLVYSLGRFFGDRLVQSKMFKKSSWSKSFTKINKIYDKYSYWGCAFFRFLPGIRFPGHLSCGIMKVPLLQFLTIDGLAALLSVPTQVILVAFYGELILEKIRQFKMVIVIILGIGATLWLGKKLYFYIKDKSSTVSSN